MRTILAALIAALFLTTLTSAEADAGKYKNFRTAIYVVVDSTKALADPKIFAQQYDRMQRQLKFDKVYIEVYRSGMFATDAEVDAVKNAFMAKGIAVAGGITLASNERSSQFRSFDYENPRELTECQQAAEEAARHFDEVILDDFFFFNTKSDLDIAAKGDRSWTQYRIERMREVAKDRVLGPAKATNPNVKVIIKYPNWYEHFQGLGFDLDKEAQMFDGIYTGTETRDPIITDQLLQQYESYEIIRYFNNIRPGGNGGGWVDTYGVRYVDRYAEQLWDTAFAKAPQIVLFNWHDLAVGNVFAPMVPGERQSWEKRPTTFNWNDMAKTYRSTGKGDPIGWGSVAGYSLEQVDKALSALGNPIGIASYKPYQSHGEDFLQHYLGNIGIPIEMTPVFPDGPGVVLLTEQAKFDPDIIAKIDRKLKAGGKVVITSGFLRAMQDKGFKNIAEWEDTGRVLGVHVYANGFGSGNGAFLNDPKKASSDILFPEISFYTNDSWGIIRGIAGAKGNPILLMNDYSKGAVYLLNIPENMADLYNLPQPVITRIKHYLLQDFPVRIDAPDLVTMFAYDNNTLAVESFRNGPSAVNVIVPSQSAKLRDLASGKLIAAKPAKAPANRFGFKEPPVTTFAISLEAHSWRTYRIEH